MVPKAKAAGAKALQGQKKKASKNLAGARIDRLAPAHRPRTASDIYDALEDMDIDENDLSDRMVGRMVDQVMSRQNTLLDLPQEVRDLILGHLFSNKVFRFGSNDASTKSSSTNNDESLATTLSLISKQFV